MSRAPRMVYATGEPVTVHPDGTGQREVAWRAASVVAWCEIAGEVWVTVHWHDPEPGGPTTDLVLGSRCRKVTPSGLRRADA